MIEPISYLYDTEEADDDTASGLKVEEKRLSGTYLETPQSKSAVHYLSISPPRIKVTDESNRTKHSNVLKNGRNGTGIKEKFPRKYMAHKKVTSNPELTLPDKISTTKTSSRSPSSVSSRESSPIPHFFSNKSLQGVTGRRSSCCLAVPNMYSNCTSKRRLSLPNTSEKLYYSGPTLQPPPISYKKLQTSSSSSANDSSSQIILRNQKEEICGSEKSKHTFSSQTQNISSSSQASSDMQKGQQISHQNSFVKRQSSGSISSFSSQTESYVPSSGTNSTPSTINSTSSSSSNEVPEHRSSCASIHSYSTHASSRCYSISDSRRSSAATDTWNRSFCSGITSTRSRY